MSNNGFIQLHRKLLDWEWWGDHNTTVLFLYCLLKANHADKNWRGEIIKRGSFITGQIALQKETGLTRQKIRTSMQKLEKSKNLTIKSTNKFTLVTVENYDLYQVVEKKVTSKSTNEQPTNNQQITTNNNINNINNNTPPIIPPMGDEQKSLFDEDQKPKTKEKTYEEKQKPKTEKKPSKPKSLFFEEWLNGQDQDATSREWAKWAYDYTMQTYKLEKSIVVQKIKEELSNFHDYWIAASGATAKKRDWLATWRNWWRRSIKDKGRI